MLKSFARALAVLAVGVVSCTAGNSAPSASPPPTPPAASYAVKFGNGIGRVIIDPARGRVCFRNAAVLGGDDAYIAASPDAQLDNAIVKFPSAGDATGSGCAVDVMATALSAIRSQPSDHYLVFRSRATGDTISSRLRLAAEAR